MKFLALVLLAYGQDDAPRVERLDNGLRVVAIESHDAPVVCVNLWVQAGAALDEPGRPGLAHTVRVLVEHRDDAALRIRAAGGRFCAATFRDGLLFSSLVAPDLVDYVLAIEADRLTPLPPSREAVQDAIVSARRSCDDVAAFAFDSPPNDGAGRLLTAAAYADHPYGRPPWDCGGAAFTPDEVAAFLARWFAPTNATLFIIGDMSAAAAVDAARRHFGRIPWRDSPRQPELPPVPDGSLTVECPGAPRGGVDFAWVTPPWGFVENAWIDVLMQRLLNDVDGRLSAPLAAIASGPPAWGRTAWRGGGLLWLRIDAPPANHAAVERAVANALEAARQPGPTPPEGVPDAVARDVDAEVVGLLRAKAMAAAAVARAKSDAPERAAWLTLHEVLGGDALLDAYDLPRIERTNPAALNAAAELLSNARRVVLHRSGDTATPAPASGPGAAGNRDGDADGVRRLDAGATLELLASRTAPPVRPPAGVPRSVEHVNGYPVEWCAGPMGRGAAVMATVSVASSTLESRAAGLQAYASLHGIRVSTTAGAGCGCILLEGRSEQVGAMIELLVRAPAPAFQGEARPSFDGGESRRSGQKAVESPAALADRLAVRAEEAADPTVVRLTVLGEYDAAETRALLAELPAGGPPGTATAPTNGAARPTLFWSSAPAADACELRVVVGPARGAAGPGAAEVCRLACSLAADEGQGARLDQRRAWRWSWRPLTPGVVVFSACAAPHEAVDELRRFVTRFDDARAGRLPDVQRAAAQRLADLRGRHAGDFAAVAWYLSTDARAAPRAGDRADAAQVSALAWVGPVPPPADAAWLGELATLRRVEPP